MVMMLVKYSREPSDSKPAEPHDASIAEKVNIRRNPSAVVKTLQHIRSFVITSDDNRHHGSCLSTGEIVMKGVHLPVFLRHSLNDYTFKINGSSPDDIRTM